MMRSDDLIATSEVPLLYGKQCAHALPRCGTDAGVGKLYKFGQPPGPLELLSDMSRSVKAKVLFSLTARNNACVFARHRCNPQPRKMRRCHKGKCASETQRTRTVLRDSCK
jgi:hypothetical protein